MIQLWHSILNFDPYEFHDIRWFPIDNIPFKKSDPHIQRCMQKIISQLKGKNNE